MRLDEYKDSYQDIKMERRGGVLEMRFHTHGGPLVWGESIHRELSSALSAIGQDRENRVVILTGTGDVFCTEFDIPSFGSLETPADWDKIYWEAKRLLTAMLEIEVPVISAINGPAGVHAELMVVGDITLATEAVWFRDSHMLDGAVPADGVHLIWPLLLGPNRGSYFLTTSQKLDAADALALGVVNEIVGADQLLPRARELAAKLLEKPELVLRYTRVSLTQQIKRLLLDGLGYGLALEGLASLEARLPHDG